MYKKMIAFLTDLTTSLTHLLLPQPQLKPIPVRVKNHPYKNYR